MVIMLSFLTVLTKQKKSVGEGGKEDIAGYEPTLWKNVDFLKLWVGETVSLLGTQITLFALPLTAVLMLRATPLQMGILRAAEYAPFLVVTLFLGVWIDRRPRRPVLIFANLMRSILFGSIPLCAMLGILQIEYLYLVAFLTGILMVCFQLAYQAFLPTLVGRERISEGNSKLSVSDSLAQIAGPGLGGILVQLMTAPLAIVWDACSFLFSSLLLLSIRRSEVVPVSTERPQLWQEIKQGMGITLGNPYIRALAGGAAVYSLFSNCILAVYILFALQELHISPGVLSVILSLGSIGSLIGALLARPLERRVGLGPTLVWVMLVLCLTPLLYPLAYGITAGTLIFTLIAFLTGMALTIYNVHVVSLRQAVTPNHLLGRMNASYRFLTWGFTPLGSLLGGFLGNAIGLRVTLLVGALGLGGACLWVVLSPVSKLKQLPRLPEEDEERSNVSYP